MKSILALIKPIAIVPVPMPNEELGCLLSPAVDMPLSCALEGPLNLKNVCSDSQCIAELMRGFPFLIHGLSPYCGDLYFLSQLSVRLDSFISSPLSLQCESKLEWSGFNPCFQLGDLIT